MSAILEMPAKSSTTRTSSIPPANSAKASEPQPRPIEPRPGGSAAVAPDRIVLTGFMGSGKTTVGSLLAERLAWRFLDLDHEIERREGRSVPAIFAESGEAHFRRLEARGLAALLGERRVVVGLGGGAAENLGNRLLLEQTPRTTVIYLCAPLETLLTRCRHDAAAPGIAERPLLVEAESRFRTRQPLYERMSGLTIQTASLDPEQVAAAILRTLQAKA